MIRLAIPIVILLLMLFAGAVWALFAYLDLPEMAGTPPAETTRVQSDRAPTPAETERVEASHQNSGASFDVARIDPEGTSVFAGRAKPGYSVTITADGEPIGTTEADANGEWTFTVERRFANADPELGLRSAPASQTRESEVARAEPSGSADTPAKPAPGERRSASTVTTHLLKDLEGMVETARSEQSKQRLAQAAETPGVETRTAETPVAETPATLPESDASRDSVAAVRIAPQAQPDPSAPPRRKTVPVPITFVFNEATFTDNGRKAASLLLEYLKLKHFKKVSLTGHADERGTEELNFNLSRERLDTVAGFLKEGGFEGQLELIPKGESEPFTGVVRSEYDREDLYQLDRRVELVITH